MDIDKTQALVLGSAVFIALGALVISTTVRTIGSKIMKSYALSPLQPMVHIVICIFLISSLCFSNYRRIFGHPRPLHPETWELAQQIKKNARPNAKIVTLGEYTIHKGGNDLSPVLYYYSRMQGWSLRQGDWNFEKLQKLIHKGATLFAATNMSREPESLPFIDKMRSSFKILYENKVKDIVLLDLTNIVNDRPKSKSFN